MLNERRYYPALDGIRCVAIASVLALHGGRSLAPGGFLGVDLFFALSGFLITRVLLNDYASDGKIMIGKFWGRRARRILPAFGIFLLLAFALWPVIPDPQPNFVRAALPAVAYVANIQATLDASKLGALIHTWSLSTEEQFYLCWPVLLAVLLARGRWRAIAVLGLLIALAAAGRAHGRYVGTSWADYYSPLVRVDELLVGCALALVPGRQLERASFVYQPLAWAFVAAFPWLLMRLSPELDGLYMGGYSLFALGAASVICVATDTRPTLIQKALSQRWLVFIGRRSYGIYLYHLPIFMALEGLRVPHDAANFIWVTALRVGCTLVVAEASYRLVERPILDLRRERSKALSVSPASNLSRP